jgi:hypothetical protein
MQISAFLEQAQKLVNDWLMVVRRRTARDR